MILFFVAVKKGQPKRTDERLMHLIVGRLKELRVESGYSQEYVIEHTRLNLSQYEAGMRLPSFDSLSILCRFYGISLREFFSTIDYPHRDGR